MSPRFSILIPARNEEARIGACLRSIEEAGRPYAGEVEVVVAINRCTDRTETMARDRGAVIVHEPAKNLSRIRNAAAGVATGEILITIDADSTMSPNMLQEIDAALGSGKVIGGGVVIRPERVSVGILLSALVIFVPLYLRYRVSAGLLWCRREDFHAIGGFDETLASVEDLDFGRRLKAYGRAQGKRYRTLWRTHITTSCRKFDWLGDWCLLRNPRLVWTLLKGKDQAMADRFYYDVRR